MPVYRYLCAVYAVVELRGSLGAAPLLCLRFPLLVFKVEALGASLGPPTSVEKRDSVFGPDGPRTPSDDLTVARNKI